jgi:hypothetical protein
LYSICPNQELEIKALRILGKGAKIKKYMKPFKMNNVNNIEEIIIYIEDY